MRPRRPLRILAPLALALALAAPRTAPANPWTRDAGHFFASLNLSWLAAKSFYGPQIGAPSIPLAVTL